MADQSNNYTQLQLDKPISLLELLAGVWVRVTSRAATIFKKKQTCISLGYSSQKWHLWSSLHDLEAVQQARGLLSPQQYLLLIQPRRGRGIINFVSFRDFQRLLSCLLPVCLQDGTFQFRGNCYTTQPGFFWGIPKWCQGKWAMQGKEAMSGHNNIGHKFRDHNRLGCV